MSCLYTDNSIILTYTCQAEHTRQNWLSLKFLVYQSKSYFFFLVKILAMVLDCKKTKTV